MANDDINVGTCTVYLRLQRGTRESYDDPRLYGASDSE